MLHTAIDRARRVRRSGQAGFTLIELLIVIVILGVLAGIVVFSVSGIDNKSKVNACKADVETVTTAAEAYYAQNNAYPGTSNATASAKLVPGFLHSYPTDVTYTAADTATSPTITGTVAGC